MREITGADVRFAVWVVSAVWLFILVVVTVMCLMWKSHIGWALVLAVVALSLVFAGASLWLVFV